MLVPLLALAARVVLWVHSPRDASLELLLRATQRDEAVAHFVRRQAHFRPQHVAFAAPLVVLQLLHAPFDVRMAQLLDVLPRVNRQLE